MDVTSHPARLAVGVVGTGRVGAALGAALARAGHRVVGAYAVSDTSRARAEALLPGVPVLADPAEAVRRAELVVLAVPDDALPDLVSGLASTGAWQAGQIVAHTSGRHGVAVLDPAREHHVLPLALHPAMTFTGT
ncbi:MAG: NAD(P)-binding domain-containing protein, partial [Phycicoccus sp.]